MVGYDFQIANGGSGALADYFAADREPCVSFGE